MHKIDHIAIAVNSLATSIPLFEKLLDTTCYKVEEVASEKVKTALFSELQEVVGKSAATKVMNYYKNK